MVAVHTVAADHPKFTPRPMDDTGRVEIVNCRRSLPHRRRRPLQTAKSYGAYLPWTISEMHPPTPHKRPHMRADPPHTVRTDTNNPFLDFTPSCNARRATCGRVSVHQCRCASLMARCRQTGWAKRLRLPDHMSRSRGPQSDSRLWQGRLRFSLRFLIHFAKRYWIYSFESVKPCIDSIIRLLVKVGARVLYHARRWHVHVAGLTLLPGTTGFYAP